MPEHDFERRLERLLRDDAEKGVRPIDAVAIARGAVRGRSRDLPWASLLRGTRWVLVATLLAVIGVGTFVFGSGLLVLPAPTPTPSPSATAVAQSPIAPSPAPTASVSPSPSASDGPTPIITGPRATPSPSPDATPTIVVSPPPSGVASPSPSATVSPSPSASFEPSPSPSASPAPSPTVSSTPGAAWTTVAAGSEHACAIRVGTIFCWGENSMGELGDGTTSSRWTPAVPVAGLGPAVDVAAGIRFTCAVATDGSVSCWGEHLYDDGATSVAEPVGGIDDAVAIGAGGAHACALRAAGDVACWGLGQLGQLGNGTVVHNEGNAEPVAVSGIDDAIAISAGWNHTCALRADQTVWCWGGNGDGAIGYGQIGDGTLANAPSPVQVVGLDEVVALSAGGWTTCAVRADGSAWCWGYGERGGLGDGQSANSATPVQVSGIDDAVGITVGGWHACAIRAAGNVACWGDNSFAGGGGVGDGTRTDRPTPVDALGISDVHELAAGFYSSFAIRSDGTLWGWGWYLDSVPGPVPGAE